jgi:hypothetical protein
MSEARHAIKWWENDGRRYRESMENDINSWTIDQRLIKLDNLDRYRENGSHQWKMMDNS